jgi:hypothetical protein
MGKKSRRIKPAKTRMPFVARTFEGLPSEVDWIAMREFVPSASASVTTTSGRTVRVCSLLPGGGAGLVRPDGEIWLGLQVLHNHGDISRDLAHVIELAEGLEPGTPVTMTNPGVGPRLQELIAGDQAFDVTVHAGFDYWIDNPDEQAQAALAQANESAAPTRRLAGVEGAYVTQMGDHTFLRWVRPEGEDALLLALARLHAAGQTQFGEAKLIGIFRAHGLLVPVWELFGATDLGESIEADLAAFEPVLAAALDRDEPLTPAERSAKQNLTSRQVTIR